MNPGDTVTLAGDWLESPTLNEGRGVNPGDTWLERPRSRPSLALNEGRGVNPGDTSNDDVAGRNGCLRSTKAGA